MRLIGQGVGFVGVLVLAIASLTCVVSAEPGTDWIQVGLIAVAVGLLSEIAERLKDLGQHFPNPETAAPTENQSSTTRTVSPEEAERMRERARQMKRNR